MPSIKVPATMDNLDEMIEFVITGVSDFGLDDEACLKRIRLVCEEILVNIIEYGYPDEPGQVKINYRIIKEEKVVIKIVDKGIPFDPTEFRKPDLCNCLEDCDIGGFGIYLVKKIVDEMKYKRNRGKNILTLMKFIN
ncbi:MAG: ATP-binding protein [Bacillota bacterium]